MNASQDKVSILVVDDDPQKLLTLETVLSELDQNVVCVRSGRDALRQLLSNSFAVILLDVNMPGMDGFETASLIRQRKECESTPIIFITAYGDDLFVERGYSLGAVDYILTPLVPEVLRSKVSVFVHLYRQTDEIRRQADRLSQRTAQLSALANQLTDAEHRERRRLAQILHDHLQQLLVAAKMRVSTVSPLAPEEIRGELQSVDKLLDESIATSRSLTVELSPPILHDGGLRKALEWLARRFEQNHALAVHISGRGDVPPLPEHMRSFLYQAARELLFNIVKHAGVSEAWLTIEATRQTLRLTVEDRGSGFRDNSGDRPRGAMEHFGLFSIRERLVFLNGTLDVDSVPDRGTRITMAVPVEPTDVTIPEAVCAAPAVAAAAPPPNGRIRNGSAIRVLLVDDHEMLRKGLVNLLQAHSDISVIGEAADGEQAVELAGKLMPDVIVMDLAMPRMNGIEATQRIMATYSGIQVIGLSMHDASEMARAVCDAGAVSYLNKAGPPDQLVAAIRATRPAAPAASPAVAALRGDEA